MSYFFRLFIWHCAIYSYKYNALNETLDLEVSNEPEILKAHHSVPKLDKFRNSKNKQLKKYTWFSI